MPQAIISWSTLLSQLPDDVRDLILAVVRQLSPLMEGVPLSKEQGEFTPDGIDSIGRQVQYERLLTSEWTLLDQFPDEFLRRAVTAEHLFYQMATIEREENRTCYAVFDCGPLQLGKPRLVQMAILILLARRAEKSNVLFKWGVLQDPQKKFHLGLSQDAIYQWLGLRSCELVDEAAAANWVNAAIDDYGAALDDTELTVKAALQDFWLISPMEVIGAPPTTRRLAIAEPLLAPGYIDVDVISERYHRSARLELLREDVGVKLIRQPFPSSVNKLPAVLNLIGAWVSSASGRRLGCRHENEKVVVHAIGHTRNKAHPTVVALPAGQTCLGLHINKKRVFAVSEDRDHFYFHNYPSNGQVKKSVKSQKIPTTDTQGIFLSTVLLCDVKGNDVLYLLDARNKLRCAVLNEAGSLFHTKCEHVLALGSLVSCDYYIEHDRKNSQLLFHYYLTAYPPSKATYTFDEDIREPEFCVFGGGQWHKGSVGCFAYKSSAQAWTLVSGQETQKVVISQGDRVIGVIALSYDLKSAWRAGHAGQIVLVILKPDNRSVHAVNANHDFLLHTLKSEFARGELNPQLPYLHYVNLEDEFIVVDLMKGTLLLNDQLRGDV